MNGKTDGKRKRLLLLAVVVVIGIVLIIADGSSAPASYSGTSSGSADCFRCNDTGKCPECRGLKDCRYVFGASHRCVNGLIYYGSDVLVCSSCDGTGDCDECDGTGRCPYCR